jgi:hypothetical protein
MPFKRGEVVRARVPDSNLRAAKRGPALIVQADGPESARILRAPAARGTELGDRGYDCQQRSTGGSPEPGLYEKIRQGRREYCPGRQG